MGRDESSESHACLSNHVPVGIFKTNRYRLILQRVAYTSIRGSRLQDTNLLPVLLEALQPQDRIHPRDAQPMPLSKDAHVEHNGVCNVVVPDSSADGVGNWSRRFERWVQREGLYMHTGHKSENPLRRSNQTRRTQLLLPRASYSAGAPPCT